MRIASVDFYDLLTRFPVNRQSAIVTSSARVFEPTLEDMRHHVRRLQRKHSLLKSVLHIKTATQHCNLMNNFKRQGRRVHRFNRDQRALREYIRLGQDIQEVIRAIQVAKAHVPKHPEQEQWTPERKAAYRASHGAQA